MRKRGTKEEKDRHILNNIQKVRHLIILIMT